MVSCSMTLKDELQLQDCLETCRFFSPGERQHRGLPPKFCGQLRVLAVLALWAGGARAVTEGPVAQLASVMCFYPVTIVIFLLFWFGSLRREHSPMRIKWIISLDLFLNLHLWYTNCPSARGVNSPVWGWNAFVLERNVWKLALMTWSHKTV